MFARMLVAAALILGTGVAFASDASYDQQQIREGNVARSAAKQEKVTQAEKGSHAHGGHTMVCSCSM